MEALKTLMYAGIGLAKQTETQVKESFDSLVAKGKRLDESGLYVVRDLFKALDENKDKLHDQLTPFLERAEELIQKYKKDNS